MSKRTYTGKIVSKKMQKTVVVAVEMHKSHSVYNKAIKNTRRFKTRNEIGAKTGDTVIIEESPPYSRGVTFKILKVVEGEVR